MRRRKARHRFGVIGVPAVVTLVLSVTPAAQSPSLAQVLQHATDFVETLHTQLSGVVMEERYEQRASGPSLGGFGDTYDRVTLRSDYLLVQPEGADRYYGFRDVFEASGQAVRDRSERLTELFLDESASAERRIQGILADSARYNIGSVARNTNIPTFALLFLRSDYKVRFEFEPARDQTLPLGLDLPNEATDLTVVAYRETWPTTLVGGRGDTNLPARGRFWLEPVSGRVWLTELVLADDEMDSVIAVRYEVDPEMGHVVPIEMRERYDNRRARSRVEGTATYRRFRRFRVEVDESTPPVTEPEPRF